MATSYTGKFQTDYCTTLIVQVGTGIFSMRIPELSDKLSIAPYIVVAILENKMEIDTGSFDQGEQTGVFSVTVETQAVQCTVAKDFYSFPKRVEEVTQSYYDDHDVV